MGGGSKWGSRRGNGTKTDASPGRMGEVACHHFTRDIAFTGPQTARGARASLLHNPRAPRPGRSGSATASPEIQHWPGHRQQVGARGGESRRTTRAPERREVVAPPTSPRIVAGPRRRCKPSPAPAIHRSGSPLSAPLQGSTRHAPAFTGPRTKRPCTGGPGESRVGGHTDAGLGAHASIVVVVRQDARHRESDV